MRVLQNIINVFFSILVFFILFNIILALVWEIRTTYKLKNLKPYSDEVLKILDLNEEEGLSLYLETWINRKYEYDQFVEWREQETPSQQFVNVSDEFGRKVEGNDNCEKSFYFYGGSTTFGYNVTDYQTIPSYFKKIIDLNYSDKNYCVYNFGRAGFASPWENILFQKHLSNKKINQGDFIFFIDGINERGNADGINSKFFYESQKTLTRKYWDIYKPTMSLFFQSIPMMQLVTRIQQKNRTPEIFNCNDNELVASINYEFQCHSIKNVQQVLQHNVNIRKAICEDQNLNCYTFIQPFSLVHGKYFEKYEKSEAIETGRIKDYESFKFRQKRIFDELTKTQNVIDISVSLNNATELSYVDRSHYSPQASQAISEYIYSIVKKDIK